MTDKVRPGDRMRNHPMKRARNINRLIDVADAYHREQALGQAGAPPKQRFPESNRVTVKNSTGAARAKGEVVQLGDSIIDSVNKGELWLDSALPDSSPTERFAILTQPLPDEKIGYRAGQVSGVCFALVDVTDADHKYATPAASDAILQSAEVGPVKILYKPSGTGDAKECVVKICCEDSGRVKVNADDTLDYLEDQCKDHNATAAYDATYDTLIKVDTVDSGSDPKLRWFIDASAQTGYATPTNDATALIMVLTSTGWELKTPAQFLALLTGYNGSNDQSIGHDASGTPEWQDDEEC